MRFPRPLQVTRRSVQIGVFALILVTPILARYTNYLSARQLDRTLERLEGSPQGRTLDAVDRALRTIHPDVERAGRSVRDRDAVMRSASALRGTTWSFELFGMSLTDPLAALESIAASRKVRWVMISGILLPVLLSILLGRIFCSWICPVGFALEVTGKTRKLLRFLELRPGRVRLWDGNRFLVLGIGLGLAACFGAPFLGYLYPPALLGREIHNGATVFFDRAEEGMLGFTAAGLTLASWFLVGIAVIEIAFGARIWCRSLCPGGAVYSLLGRFRLVRVRRDPAACTHCGECVRRCEMGLSPMTDVTGMRCDNCGECVSHCPDDALGFHLGQEGTRS